jgi:DNA-binding CsgD family transcriptional regulator/tetratricopeptide (TPR) repeat protein
VTVAEHPLPGALRPIPRLPFVGRAQELAAARTLLPRAEDEGGRVLLVGGEPGSGKSRLVREFAAEEAAAGVLVLHGACDAVVHTPYGPLVEALDHLVRVVDPDVLRADLGTTGGEITRLLPDLRRQFAELPEPVAGDPDTERHRLHTAVTDLLTRVGRRQPIVLVLEDCHWADVPTLLFLRHFARAGAGARTLLLATFRDTEAEMPVDLADALADLRRSESTVRLHLEGLTEAEIAEFVRRVAGAEDHDLARGIADLTSGNPFLVCELWRELVDTGALTVAELPTPQSVREVVSQRLLRLGPTTAQLLELAAVAGREFELDLLRRAASLDAAASGEAIEQAVLSGIVEELPGGRLAYRFTHELVRRALHDRVSALRRAELHLRVAEALEAAPGPRTRRELADLAYHFASAAPLGGHERAVEYSLLAADAASAALAHEEAAARLRAALELGIEDERRRSGIELALGEACYRGGASVGALEAFGAAAELARGLGESELLAEAAIGYEATCWRPGLVDQGALELLDEASDALAEQDSTLRVRLLSGLSRALGYQGDHRAASVRAAAIAMARRLDDRPALAKVLATSYWSRGASSLEEIIAMLTESHELAAALGDIETQAEAMEWQIAALIARGDLEAAWRELKAVLELVGQARQPFMSHVAEHYRSAISLCTGDFEQAEAAAERSHEWSRLLSGRDPSGVYGIQMFSLRREQGRLAELAPVIRVLAAGDRAGAWRPGFAALLAELGMDDDVRRELAVVRAESLDGFRDSLWMAALTYLADAAAAVGDADVADVVYPELAAHAGTNVMIGHGVACYGAADRYLGMLAAARGDLELADEHFEAAIDFNRRMGATTWVAHTAYEQARALSARGGAGDRERAGRLAGEAAALAERIGMPTLLARARALGSVEPAPLPDGLSHREVEILRLVTRGLSNREIGAELIISEHTAANHVRSILRKTGCANRTDAASYAHRRGLVEH